MQALEHRGAGGVEREAGAEAQVLEAGRRVREPRRKRGQRRVAQVEAPECRGERDGGQRRDCRAPEVEDLELGHGEDPGGDRRERILGEREVTHALPVREVIGEMFDLIALHAGVFEARESRDDLRKRLQTAGVGGERGEGREAREQRGERAERCVGDVEGGEVRQVAEGLGERRERGVRDVEVRERAEAAEGRGERREAGVLEVEFAQALEGTEALGKRGELGVGQGEVREVVQRAEAVGERREGGQVEVEDPERGE